MIVWTETRLFAKPATDAILALDPSSTRTGWAWFSAGTLREAGYMTGAKRSDPAIARIAAMDEQVRELVEQIRPRVVVVEITSGHVQARHKGGGAGLATYGMAVGALAIGASRSMVELVLRAYDIPSLYGVYTVAENEWTRSRNKRVRQRALAARTPGYDASKDAGADAGDAIQIGEWYLERERLALAEYRQAKMLAAVKGEK